MRETLPKPIGLPALKQPKALFLRGLGLSYIVPSIPCAGGTADAEKMPNTPQRISIVIPFLAKPVPRQRTEKRNMEPMNIDFRPKRSAILPKKRSRAPADSLAYQSAHSLGSLQSDTYDTAAFVQVTSALVMPKSLAANELMTVIDPVKKLVMATAIVTESTKRHSWSVDLKHAGRAFGSVSSCSLIGDVECAPSSGSVLMLCGRGRVT
jgi:hypothetical protein